ERRGDQDEEEAGGSLLGETALPRNERRAVVPRRGRRDPDETGRDDARGERRRPVGHGSGGRPPFAEAPPRPELVSAAAGDGAASCAGVAESFGGVSLGGGGVAVFSSVVVGALGGAT